MAFFMECLMIELGIAIWFASYLIEEEQYIEEN